MLTRVHKNMIAILYGRNYVIAITDCRYPCNVHYRFLSTNSKHHFFHYNVYPENHKQLICAYITSKYESLRIQSIRLSFELKKKR